MTLRFAPFAPWFMTVHQKKCSLWLSKTLKSSRGNIKFTQQKCRWTLKSQQISGHFLPLISWCWWPNPEKTEQQTQTTKYTLWHVIRAFTVFCFDQVYQIYRRASSHLLKAELMSIFRIYALKAKEKELAEANERQTLLLGCAFRLCTQRRFLGRGMWLMCTRWQHWWMPVSR